MYYFPEKSGRIANIGYGRIVASKEAVSWPYKGRIVAV